MDLEYLTENNAVVAEKLASEGLDIESLLILCDEMINLSNDLDLEIGDLRDLIYRLRNRYDFVNGVTPESRQRCEDTCPAKLTFQPNGSTNIFFFNRTPGLNEAVYKVATFSCEVCGPDIKLTKKEIKDHINLVHK